MCAESQSSFPKELFPKVVNHVFSEADAIVENQENGQLVDTQASVLEMYRMGRLQIHAHFACHVSKAGQLNSENFCAVFRSFPFFGEVLERNWQVSSADQFYGPELFYCDDQQSVFVDHVKLRNGPNDVIFTVIPGPVRLQLLDLCNGCVGYEWGDLVIDKTIKRLLLKVDGKLNPVFPFGDPRWAVLKSELVRKMVKRRTYIVNTVTDHQRDRWVKWRALWEHDDKLLCLGIEVYGSRYFSFRFRRPEPLDGRIDLTEVVFCPT